MRVSFVILCVALLGQRCLSQPKPASDWRYVVPARSGEPHLELPFRALPISTRPPADVEVRIRFGKGTQWFTQLRYGSPGTVRVAVVVDRRPSKEVAIYVDADRDRVLDDSDLLPGKGPEWRISLDAIVFGAGPPRSVPRTVAFHLGRSGNTLGFCTVGHVEGTVLVGQRKLKGRRFDGDGNGLFGDARDSLWLDRDGNGLLDPIAELQPLRPVLEIDGLRHAVYAVPDGSALRLARFDKEGDVRLTMPTVPGKVTEVLVTLVSKDGLALGLRDPKETVSVPAGSYRITHVQLTLADAKGGLPWTYVFSRSGGRTDQPWHEVESGRTLELDPIGKLDFLIEGHDPGTSRQPGASILVNPRLYTQDGLLINTCTRGEFDFGGPSAQIRLLGAKGAVVDNSSSGFA